MKYTVRLDYATYEKIVVVEAEDGDEAISLAWASVKKWLTLPMAYKSGKIIKAE